MVISINGSRPIVDYQPTQRPVEDAGAAGLLPVDRVSISPEARRRQDQEGQSGAEPQGDGRGTPDEPQGGATTASQPGTPRQLDRSQQQQVEELKARDAHVRAHEAAHQAAGGDLTGPASFTYQTGPDGRSYAVGGEVPVAARTGRTPDETIAIARRVRAAALAPGDPSAADLAAAATATQLELQGEAQKRAQAAAQVSAAPAASGQQAPRSAASLQALTAAGMPYTALERLMVRAPEPAEIF
jgi:SprA-related family